MDTKSEVLKKMGLTKLGKKTRLRGFEDNKDIHFFAGEKIILEVQRYNKTVDFVIGRYDHQRKLYLVAYDPNTKGGRIEKIINAYA